MKYKKVVVLTGAGISAESGLKTFRDNDGLWEKHKVEDVATPEAFMRNPNLVYKFYNQRRRQLLNDAVQPNAAHVALADLERVLGDDLLVVTQNVDNLHQRAGSKNVLHMHGDLLSARCCKSNQVFTVNTDFDSTNRCNCCVPSQPIRPNIVWFGEMPLYMDKVTNALWEADLFISIGTSGNVYPAAGFVQEAKHGGAYTVELNLEPSLGQSNFDQKYYGKASKIVPEFVNTLLSELC